MRADAFVIRGIHRFMRQISRPIDKDTAHSVDRKRQKHTQGGLAPNSRRCSRTNEYFGITFWNHSHELSSSRLISTSVTPRPVKAFPAALNKQTIMAEVDSRPTPSQYRITVTLQTAYHLFLPLLIVSRADVFAVSIYNSYCGGRYRIGCFRVYM